ncbi:MAG: amidohydrolase family protein [Leucobacter sp.]
MTKRVRNRVSTPLCSAQPAILSQDDSTEIITFQTEAPLSPSQALTLEEVLAAYTSGSASLVLGAAGRVRVGERADLVVATEDPFGVPSEQLYRVATAATIVEGEVVFERASA